MSVKCQVFLSTIIRNLLTELAYVAVASDWLVRQLLCRIFMCDKKIMSNDNFIIISLLRLCLSVCLSCMHSLTFEKNANKWVEDIGDYNFPSQL